MPEALARPKLLFVCLQRTSFVRDDLALLSERYDVRLFVFEGSRFGSRLGRLWGLASYGTRLAAWLLRESPGASLIYGWLADYHLVLPVLAGKRWGKPVAVALAGADGNRIPEIGYGVFHSRWRAPLAQFVLSNASILLPVTEALIYAENRYSTWPEVRRNGVREHVPGLDTPYRVIPTGYDPDVWPMGAEARSDVVCTVGWIISERTVRLKGIDLLIETARRMPDVRFEVVGVAESVRPYIQQTFNPTANVHLLPPKPRDALPPMYGRAAVYAQLSMSEGLPNALCEAMLCGCIPVGSAVSGIPDAIGDTGMLVDRADPDVVAAAIREAQALGPEARHRARARIVDRFGKERRRNDLLETLARLHEPGAPQRPLHP